jgi:dTDP-4-dehydrorhamnose reductase
MKAIITGMTGTLAPYVYEYFSNHGCEMIIWHTSDVAIDDPKAINQFITDVQPDVFLHIATGPVSWIEYILVALKPYNIPFVFTSSEAVFDEKQLGPHNVESIPRAKGDYGKYKIACENIINRDYEKNSYIMRLGWQIALHTHKNNLLAFLVNEAHIEASTKWILAASFMPDTAEAIFNILSLKPDIYHLDGNHDNWDFYTLCHSLKAAFKLPITIEATDDFDHNTRLESHPILIRSIQQRIKMILHQK